jgi:uncharacterized membrane protein
MKSFPLDRILAAAVLVSAAAAFTAAQTTTQTRAMHLSHVPYSTVAPLIKAQCAGCHNDKRHPENVDLSSYAALIKSNVAVAGHPEKSRLIAYVDGTKKPRMPMGKMPLTAAQITLLKKWISAGAKP